MWTLLLFEKFDAQYLHLRLVVAIDGGQIADLRIVEDPDLLQLRLGIAVHIGSHLAVLLHSLELLQLFLLIKELLAMLHLPYLGLTLEAESFLLFLLKAFPDLP